MKNLQNAIIQAHQPELAMAALTEQNRRHALDQALANTRIEGHVPSADFLADCEQFAQGRMSTAEVRSASLARALEAQRDADAASGTSRDAA